MSEHTKETTLQNTDCKNVHGALSLDYSGESNVKFYKDWAKTYDDDVSNEAYVAPSTMADIMEGLVKEYFAAAPPAVCDMGCGSGLVAEVVCQRQAKGEASPYSVFDGFDISPEMVELSVQKKVYKNCWGSVDLTKPCVGQGNGELKAGMYDLGVACGVWTLGHVTAESLPYAMELMKPGGILVVSVRMSYCAEHGFDAACRKAVESVGGSVIDIKDGPYIKAEGAKYYIIQTKK